MFYLSRYSLFFSPRFYWVAFSCRFCQPCQLGCLRGSSSHMARQSSAQNVYAMLGSSVRASAPISATAGYYLSCLRLIFRGFDIDLVPRHPSDRPRWICVNGVEIGKTKEKKKDNQGCGRKWNCEPSNYGIGRCFKSVQGSGENEMTCLGILEAKMFHSVTVAGPASPPCPAPPQLFRKFSPRPVTKAQDLKCFHGSGAVEVQLGHL